MTDRWFDIVLVHADHRLARLEDSFRPTKPLRTPVHDTGYVVPARDAAVHAPRGEHLLVSAGGGIVGGPLFDLVLQARTLMSRPLPLRIVAGPFLPEPQWLALLRQVRGSSGVELVRQVPDMVAEMRRARASLSQCGYNTALDIVVSGVPALVVPYATATENEQQSRATRLHALGAMRCARTTTLDARAPTDELDARALASELEALLRFEPSATALDLNGASRSADLLRQLAVPR
jgi:predicted glycosyltransferase